MWWKENATLIPIPVGSCKNIITNCGEHMKFGHTTKNTTVDALLYNSLITIFLI